MVSIVHIAALAVSWDAVSAPTKLALMPLLAVGAGWAGRRSGWGSPYTLLFLAIAFSWAGDGAGTFVPELPQIPAMLAFFALAHICYIWLFWRHLAVRTIPVWTAVYGVWWVVILAVLWPSVGALLIAVAAYGIVLGGTAVAASRCHPVIAVGAALFLASDTVLAFRLFVPAAMPAWASPLVMLTYCAGQGLIAAGVVVGLRERAGVPATASS